MRLMRRWLVVGGICGTVLGCSSADSTGPQVPDVVGTWHATKGQVTSVANAANTVDIVALGATLQIAFNANHTFVTTAVFPGEGPSTTAGTYTVTATKLTLTNDANSGGDVMVFDVALSNGTLRLTGGTIGFDFGTGEESSKLDLTLAH